LTSSYGQYLSIYDVVLNDVSGHKIASVKTAFKNTCIDIRISYKPNGTIAGIHYNTNSDRPAEFLAAQPVPPEGVAEYSFTFGDPEYRLPAVLTHPEGAESFPVVILVHGSGPSNMNESVGAQAPFRDIAWGLAQQGIGTIRYDKRTYVYPEKFTQDMTVYEETVYDAQLAALTATTLAGVDAESIYIAGHSLGGMLIPQIAADCPEADGYIMLAAPTTPIHELYVIQSQYIANLDGSISAAEQVSINAIKKAAERIAKLEEGSKVKASKLLNISAPYWLYLKNYRTAEAAKAISLPLLVLQGESDYQVSMNDFSTLNTALSGMQNVQFISYPGLTHLFAQAGDPPSPADYNQPLHVDQKVIDDIAAFVKGN